jgi:hypothetical protein
MALQGRAIIQSGLLLLIATPVARVTFSDCGAENNITGHSSQASAPVSQRTLPAFRIAPSSPPQFIVHY